MWNGFKDFEVRIGIGILLDHEWLRIAVRGNGHFAEAIEDVFGRGSGKLDTQLIEDKRSLLIVNNYETEMPTSLPNA